MDTTAVWWSLALSPIPSMFYQIKNARCLTAWKHYKEYCVDETGEEVGDLSYTSRIRSSKVNGVLKKMEIGKIGGRTVAPVEVMEK
ncbi:hypothetical protein DKX38_013066 [Salix brachista]|uniref:Uncharacterized protein n=1 Tax=Salix brachista TaxID=2182728 RepID=A0A5N5LQ52_9ROSI|nr:hypothetical protein DKX38_013066 [Salix brachista]